MGTEANLFESLYERAEAFSKTTLELTKLKALRTTTVIVTDLISKLGVIMMILMFILILTIGVALFLGELLGKAFLGFFIVAAFYLIVGLIFILFLHKWIKKPLFDLIIKQALK